MATLTDLATRMQAIAEVIPKNVNELKKKIVRTIVVDLVYVTPVDTSNALSKWTVDKSPITDRSFSPYFLGYKGSTQAQSAQEAVRDADQVLAGVKPGVPVYVGNAAPYIRKLNDEGSSRQEPAGFAQRAFLLGRKQLEGAIVTKLK
jgi:hypothetical protein